MTQLIGVVCDNGQRVLTLSDRMVSTGDMRLAYEHPRMKAEPISSHAVALTAGTIHEPDLLRETKAKAKGKDSIVQIAEIIKEHFQQIRIKKIVDEVLIPMAGICSFDEWHAKQRGLHDGLLFEVNSAIAKYEIGLSIILAGYDVEGHLILISDPGICSSFDTLSHCCIGMGERHASSVFAWFRYSRSFCYRDALYTAFLAKKRAEMAGGVGPTTDIIAIDSEGVKEVAADTVRELEEVYRDTESKTGTPASFDKRLSDLEIRTSPLATT